MIDSRAGQRRPGTMALVLLITVFVTGALAGAAMLHLSTTRAEAAVAAEQRAGPEGRGRSGTERMTRILTQRLDLTPEQQATIRAILEQRQRGADEILDEIEPRMRAHMEATTQEIRAILSPDQQLEFDRYDAERREQMDRRANGNTNGRR